MSETEAQMDRQIVETPEPASVILLAGTILCGALPVAMRRLRTSL